MIDKPIEIQRYSPDWDACESSAFLAEDSLGNAVKFSDLAPYVAAKVKEAVAKEQEKTTRVMRLLESLTPGGSEYHDDPERCEAYIRETISGSLKMIVGRKKREKAAIERAVQEERKRLREQEVEPLLKGIDYWDETTYSNDPSKIHQGECALRRAVLAVLKAQEQGKEKK